MAASDYLAGFLNPRTQAAFAETKGKAGKPLDHWQLEKVRKHVFEGTTTHKDAHDRMQELIEAHKNLYPGDGEADGDNK